MDNQTSFDKLINLLRKRKQDDSFVTELLDICATSEIKFFSSDTDASNQTKEHLLAIYERREQMEKGRQGNPFVFGYERLLPSLRKTKHTYVCISVVNSEKGTFIIFTDSTKTDFIGILKTKRTLSEIEEKYE